MKVLKDSVAGFPVSLTPKNSALIVKVKTIIRFKLFKTARKSLLSDCKLVNRDSNQLY
jgi:hypothetical protein